MFVSSTFRDMREEREVLVKRVFPQLRKVCERRGVGWGEVDLRWGIPDERRAEGRVLPICLEEIERCRPYFIGLLGERYGWVPERIDAELVGRQPWLAEHAGRSVTELEIVHGVLGDPEMAEHCFFYLRDPAYVDSLPEGAWGDHRELPSPQELEEFGAEEAGRRAEGRRRRLDDLKRRVRSSGLPHRDYPRPEALGELVLRDLARVIDELYPEGSEPDQLEREAAEHEAFARARAGVYVGGGGYFERLDAHAAGDGPPLVVVGESGIGKSALLANWALRYRESHRGELVVMHFAGSSPSSGDWDVMLRRIVGELARGLGIKGDTPDGPEELRRAFAESLHMAAARGRAVLVVDALNQLEDREGAPDLVWLPPVVPANVRVVLSTLAGRPLEALEGRGWARDPLRVEPLSAAEREDLVVAHLAQYAKELGPERVKRIAAAPQGANPLYLRALLEELRLWGEHETLGSRISHYLAAEDPGELYRLILGRYEEDFDADRPGLVGDAMSLLWAARRGLSEGELLDLLGTGGEPLPAALWSPLHLAAEQSLSRRAGLIGFSHDYLRQAVEGRYLPGEEQRVGAHLRVADYFDRRRDARRAVEELPWQLAEAGAWERLHALLADPPFLHSAWDADQYDVRRHWARVEANSHLRLADAYAGVLDDPGRHPAEQLRTVAALLVATGHPSDAFPLVDHLADAFRALGDPAGLAAALRDQATALNYRGDPNGAMALLKEAEGICRELGDPAGLAASLGNQAVILKARGDLDGAMAIHEEEERIYRELGYPAGLAVSRGNQAAVLVDRGDLDGATALLKEAERIYRELGDPEGLAVSRGNQALILQTRGDLDGAMAIHEEEVRIYRELGYPAGLAVSLGKRAGIHIGRGDLDGAMALHEEEGRICRELGDPAGLARSLVQRAEIHIVRGDLDGAMALHEQQERICRELGHPAGLAASLGNQARIHIRRGDLDGAMALHKQQERICRERGDSVGLAVSLGDQAAVLVDRGGIEGATALLEEAEGIFRELGDPAGLATTLANKSELLLRQGRARDAVPLAEEAHRLAGAAGLAPLAGQIAPILEQARRRGSVGRPVRKQTPAEPVARPRPRRGADAERAAKLNARYLRELSDWQALPRLKRLRTKKPEPPTGI